MKSCFLAGALGNDGKEEFFHLRCWRLNLRSQVIHPAYKVILAWGLSSIFGFSMAWLFPWGVSGQREEFRVCSFCVWCCADNANSCIAVKRDGTAGNCTLECLFLSLLDWRISLACTFPFVITGMLVILKFIIIYWNKLLCVITNHRWQEAKDYKKESGKDNNFERWRGRLQKEI